MRVVIADDSVLLREGLRGCWSRPASTVAASVGDGDALEAAVAKHEPILAIVDIRMPPTFTHEGAQAATRMRAAGPDVGHTAALADRSRAATRSSWRARTQRGSAICSRIASSTSPRLSTRWSESRKVARCWIRTSSPTSSAARQRATASTGSPSANGTCSALMAEGPLEPGHRPRALVLTEKTVAAAVASPWARWRSRRRRRARPHRARSGRGTLPPSSSSSPRTAPCLPAPRRVQPRSSAGVRVALRDAVSSPTIVA